MKKVSDKQVKKNRILSGIKRLLPKRCYFCGMQGTDLMHILPKSIFPQYYCEEWNLIIGCRSCHDEFDGCKEYRKKQTKLYEGILGMIRGEDIGLVEKYFGMI